MKTVIIKASGERKQLPKWVADTLIRRGDAGAVAPVKSVRLEQPEPLSEAPLPQVSMPFEAEKEAGMQEVLLTEDKKGEEEETETEETEADDRKEAENKKEEAPLALSPHKSTKAGRRKLSDKERKGALEDK